MSAHLIAAHPAADLFPMLGSDALQQLAGDIRSHGLREPLTLDPDGLLLDGRNRQRACLIAGVGPRFRTVAVDDPVAFVLSANLHRRHLTDGQKSLLATEVEAMYAASPKSKGGRPRTDAEKPGPDLAQVSEDQRKSATRAAKAVGTSRSNVRKAKKLKRDAPDLAEQVRAGSLALDRAARIQRDREAEAQRIAQARAEAERQPRPVIVDLRAGDFRDVLADVTGVDAIITDPPYPAEFLPLLADLAVFADKALKPDGVLAVLLGQTHLPDAYRLLDGHRPYRWTCCYLTDGPSYVSHARKIHSNWKPLLIYGGGPRLPDVIRAEGGNAAAKDLHKWGQDYNAFHTIIERLTAHGATVCDPFAGSGTTLLAARSLGRHAIGAETDPTAFGTASRRLT